MADALEYALEYAMEDVVEDVVDDATGGELRGRRVSVMASRGIASHRSAHGGC
ncbi:hypothetical protein [Pandoraea eparura]|uniref:hypothetical protein n=1 Tax=Pandoraea eparura TaxID=2508291 RepID=UPI001582261A|nr:hypothetical protein [Pandoraea eparura]